MNISQTPNINFLWAHLIIEELARNGVGNICLATGSRSAPLAAAAAENTKISTLVHHDERGLAYYALGLSAATGKPTALIATSGTAGANFYPAIIEASKKKLPLIVITADRPPELRFTGSNQTIDQINMFGAYVRFFFDMPCPTPDIKPAMVLTTIDQLVYRSFIDTPGPVHLNCMFREPLYHKKEEINHSRYLNELSHWLNAHTPFTAYLQKTTGINKESVTDVIDHLNNAKNGVIVAGKLKSESERQKVVTLSEKLNWPLFPDITSGLRLGHPGKNIIHYFDQILSQDRLVDEIISAYKPNTILHLGGRITSKRYYQFIEKLHPSQYIMVVNHPLRNDPLHCVTTRVEAPIDSFCNTITPEIRKRKINSFPSRMSAWSEKISGILQGYIDQQKGLSELAATRLLSQLIPENSGIFLGNSLPVRHMDMYADTKESTIIVGGNRGASGIDGTIASALGFAKGLDCLCTTFLGDLAFLHDLNSLGIQDDQEKGHIIVVLNNDGGGIFSLLPIAGYKKHFEKYFAAPHGCNFLHAAPLFGWNYALVKSKDSLRDTYKTAIKDKAKIIIEIPTKRDDNAKNQKETETLITKHFFHA